MPRKLPYFAFYADDWLSDEELRACSDGARSLWIDLLCLMHKCVRRGLLAHRDGSPFSEEEIARATGRSVETVRVLLPDLRHVFCKSGTGVIYSRRMLADDAKRRAAVSTGKKGARLKKLSRKRKNKGEGKGTLEGPLDLALSSSFAFSSEGGGVGEEGLAGGVAATHANGETVVPAATPDDGFEAFWAAYPRQAKRLAAEKAWHALAPPDELRETIMAALERQKRWDQWTSDGGKFVPFAANWLEGQRWEDCDPGPPKGQSAAERIARREREKQAQKAAETADPKLTWDEQRKIWQELRGIGKPVE